MSDHQDAAGGLKKLQTRRGHISKKRKFQKQAGRNKRKGALEALASAYGAPPVRPAAASAPSSKRLSKKLGGSGGNKSTNDDVEGEGGGGGGADAHAAVAAAGQSNWLKLSGVLNAQPKPHRRPKKAEGAKQVSSKRQKPESGVVSLVEQHCHFANWRTIPVKNYQHGGARGRETDSATAGAVGLAVRGDGGRTCKAVRVDGL